MLSNQPIKKVFTRLKYGIFLTRAHASRFLPVGSSWIGEGEVRRLLGALSSSVQSTNHSTYVLTREVDDDDMAPSLTLSTYLLEANNTKFQWLESFQRKKPPLWQRIAKGDILTSSAAMKMGLTLLFIEAFHSRAHFRKHKEGNGHRFTYSLKVR